MNNFPSLKNIVPLHNRNGWDIHSYTSAVETFSEIFQVHAQKMLKVTEVAKETYRGIREVSPFIENITREVCPSCKDVCCISRHGFYNYEDLIYMHALGLNPRPPDFTRKETDPCQFLSPAGCILDRTVRPSGCNWYFCDALFDSMERCSGYHAFDETLGRLAELWMKMISEFGNTEMLLPG